MATGRRRNATWIRAMLGFVVCLLVAPAGASADYSVRVAPDYFGVNYPLMPFDPPDVRERQLAAITATGITTVRGALSWHALEPRAPSNGVHDYDWTASDRHVGLLAEHGLRMSPAFMYTPAWAAPGAAITCANGQSITTATARPADYAAATAALVRRYGRRGSFWAQHPELPKVPITTWQIWNEPNLISYWCPGPDPAAYAHLFAMAAGAIHATDRRARVITAGLVMADRSGSFMSPGEFLAGMHAARPDIWSHTEGVGFHVFGGVPLDHQFEQISYMRDRLTAAGAPKRLPLFGTEVGWALRDLTESERAARYARVTERMPSSNCNVAVMYAQAWTTSARGGIVYDFDAGIADRDTGALLPSGVAFRDAVAALSGNGGREALHQDLSHCAGMPKLDRDRDGRAEHRDYYPLKSKRWEGPRGWYTGLEVKAKRKQRLGKRVVVKVFCEEACRLKAAGRVRLRGGNAKAALRLKPVRKRLKHGKARRLVMRPSRAAMRRIRRSDASRGKAVIRAVSIIEGERFRDTAVVRLR